MVVFKGLKRPFQAAHAFGFAHDVNITPERASAQQPYKKDTQNVALSYRIILSDNAKAGNTRGPFLSPYSPFKYICLHPSKPVGPYSAYRFLDLFCTQNTPCRILGKFPLTFGPLSGGNIHYA